ncbi:hypothetical protein LX36DRAFT_224883 [Colletotrichum falcatum]|nr:hypothetical protein LX36DRAFT_224883 [Colletotrichum falcatum]
MGSYAGERGMKSGRRTGYRMRRDALRSCIATQATGAPPDMYGDCPEEAECDEEGPEGRVEYAPRCWKCACLKGPRLGFRGWPRPLRQLHGVERAETARIVWLEVTRVRADSPHHHRASAVPGISASACRIELSQVMISRESRLKPWIHHPLRP